MDRIDRKLLKLLQEDASRTNADLAAEVGLSPSSCLRPYGGSSQSVSSTALSRFLIRPRPAGG